MYALALLISLPLSALKGCPLLQEREYRVPPVNGPLEISKDPTPPKKEKP